MQRVPVTCSRCGIEFHKPINEHRRRLRDGHTSFYCSRSCFRRVLNGRGLRGRGNSDPSKLRSDNRRDAFTPFRWFAHRIKQRPWKGISDLTVEDLKALWEAQSGECPLTGWKLILPGGSYGWERALSPHSASIDRIDNRKGYIRGNVRFVSVMANIARGRFTDDELIEFCCAVARTRG